MQFWKYQGAGNDFIMVDQRQSRWLSKDDSDQIGFLCHRRFGIGADGLILLESCPGFDFEMVYFNSDGRESTLCGNGGRCIVAFAWHLGIKRDTYRFKAIDGPHEAVLKSSDSPGLEWVELKMADISHIETMQDASSGQAYGLNTGSPHYIRFVSGLEKADMVQEGRTVRYSPRFCEAGINVNLVQEHPDHLAIRTYERGEEDETLACGTGVTAAALASFIHRGMPAGPTEIPVQAAGGNLRVRFTAHPDGSFTDVWLCGPAQRVFSGSIDL